MVARTYMTNSINGARMATEEHRHNLTLGSEEIATDVGMAEECTYVEM